MQKLQTLDYLVFLFYFIIVAGYGYWIYNKRNRQKLQPKTFGRRLAYLVGNWSIVDCFKYFSRTNDWYVGQWFFDGLGYFDL